MVKKYLIMTLLLTMCLWILVACSSSHMIANGDYIATDTELKTFIFRPEGNSVDFFWRIKGNNADYYVSGAHTYKCKIIVEEDKLYFEGRTWTDIFTQTERGLVFKYEIKYDEATKSFEVFVDS